MSSTSDFGSSSLLNPNPIIYETPKISYTNQFSASGKYDYLDIYDFISNIKDPEHPYTLQQLKVVQPELIKVEDDGTTCYISIEFTPTVPHCNLATTIGLCIREKLKREIPRNLKLDLFVTPGTHNLEKEINKQINDKERVAAAMENPYLIPLIEECLKITEV